MHHDHKSLAITVAAMGLGFAVAFAIALLLPFAAFGAYTIGGFDPFGLVYGISDIEGITTMILAAAAFVVVGHSTIAVAEDRILAAGTHE